MTTSTTVQAAPTMAAHFLAIGDELERSLARFDDDLAVLMDVFMNVPGELTR